MPNVELVRKRDLSTFRRIAIGTWRMPYDPSVYGTLEMRMERAQAYVAAFRERTGKRLTVTHMVARAVAQALREHPEANAALRFNRVYLRQRIAVFLQVVMPDPGGKKADLSGTTIHDAADKTLEQIVDEVESRVAAVRERRDPALEKSRGMMRWIPSLLLNAFMRLMAFLGYTLNLDLRRFGVERDAFGSVMVTNIGTFGLDQAYVPIIPWSRVPILLAIGEVHDAPVVEDGRLAVGKVMKVNATFDHRFIDGFHAAAMARTLRDWLEHPEEHFGAIGGTAEGPARQAAKDG
jgi:pyruvate/2-oxoglutarate dehydrogenase complex dihydrolipoamide acyltransferase (E2) component